MKTNCKFKLIVLLFLIAMSCKNHEKIKKNTTEISHFAIDRINLNQGKKWIVPAEMQGYLTQSETLVANFFPKTIVDYHLLAKQLQNLKSELVQNCTMKDQGHDALHLWLVPYMDLLDTLAATENTNDGEIIVKELTHAFEIYHQHFE